MVCIYLEILCYLCHPDTTERTLSNHTIGPFSLSASTLVSLHPRINLSPFTKDFRGEEHYNESIDNLLCPGIHQDKKINQSKDHSIYYID